jgi:hypothetical protein
MIQRVQHSLHSLYEEDETAWLDQMADLDARRRFDELDWDNLSEFLSDMARRDRREVLSRLTVLLAHLLKWEHQPDQRSNSWRATIVTQRRDLKALLESGTLRRYADEVLARAYKEAVFEAATETGLEEKAFPPDSPWSLDDVLTQQ